MTVRWIALMLSGLIASAPDAGRAAEPAVPYETLSIHSAVLDEQRRINVYTPPRYDACRAGRYPVLYMPDGGIAEDFPHVMSTVHDLIRSGAIRPVLLVGIENTVRRRDMTGPTQTPADLEIARQPGGSERFRQFFGKELVPTIHDRYRVSDESAIVGESLAGLFIVETLFAAPELFDTYIALDPSLWWNSERLIREASRRLQELDGRPARLLLAAGGAESNVIPVEKLVAELSRHAPGSLQWEYEPRPELRHDTIYRALKEPMLKAAFGLAPGEHIDCPQETSP